MEAAASALTSALADPAALGEPAPKPLRAGRAVPPAAAHPPAAPAGELLYGVDHLVVQADQVADQCGGTEAPAAATRQQDLETGVRV